MYTCGSLTLPRTGATCGTQTRQRNGVVELQASAHALCLSPHVPALTRARSCMELFALTPGSTSEVREGLRWSTFCTSVHPSSAVNSAGAVSAAHVGGTSWSSGAATPDLTLSSHPQDRQQPYPLRLELGVSPTVSRQQSRLTQSMLASEAIAAALPAASSSSLAACAHVPLAAAAPAAVSSGPLTASEACDAAERARSMPHESAVSGGTGVFLPVYRQGSLDSAATSYAKPRQRRQQRAQVGEGDQG